MTSKTENATACGHVRTWQGDACTGCSCGTGAPRIDMVMDLLSESVSLPLFEDSPAGGRGAGQATAFHTFDASLPALWEEDL